jgi:hypothetical protein
MRTGRSTSFARAMLRACRIPPPACWTLSCAAGASSTRGSATASGVMLAAMSWPWPPPTAVTATSRARSSAPVCGQFGERASRSASVNRAPESVRRRGAPSRGGVPPASTPMAFQTGGRTLPRRPKAKTTRLSNDSTATDRWAAVSAVAASTRTPHSRPGRSTYLRLSSSTTVASASIATTTPAHPQLRGSAELRHSSASSVAALPSSTRSACARTCRMRANSPRGPRGLASTYTPS